MPEKKPIQSEFGGAQRGQQSRSPFSGATSESSAPACPPGTGSSDRGPGSHGSASPESTGTMGSAASGSSYGAAARPAGLGTAGGVAQPRPGSSPAAGAHLAGSGEAGGSGPGPAAVAKSAAGELADEARQRASAAAEGVRQMAHEASQAASESVAEYRSKAADSAAEQKSRLAEELSHFGSAMRSAADRLHAEDDHRVAHYAELAAEQMDSGADYLRRRDIGGLVTDVERLARRRPDVFLGALFIGGLALSRFLKASATH